MFHASLHTVGLVSLVLAVAAVVLSKVWNTPARGHMYTVHSYIGATTVALSIFQVRPRLQCTPWLGASALPGAAQCCQVFPSKPGKEVQACGRGRSSCGRWALSRCWA